MTEKTIQKENPEMKKNRLKNPTFRKRFFAIVTVCALVLLFGLNLLVTYFGLQNSFYIDTSAEGLYTLTDEMVEECSFLDGFEKGAVRITFCADPDTLIESETTRVTYFMALKLAKIYPAFEVKTVNIKNNPTAVAMYKTTSLSAINSDDVIVSMGNIYRIASADSFWTKSDDEYWSYNGEYKLASLLLSLIGTQKVAYFVTGHGETVFRSASEGSDAECVVLHDLLVERGLLVKTLDLSQVEAIPSDCALLIINNPTEDFSYDEALGSSFAYRSDLEKIDRFLIERQGALAVAKDYRVKLPNLETYLAEWGFSFGDSLVKDEQESLPDAGNTHTALIGQYNTDKSSYGYAIYGDFVSLTSAASAIVKDTGYISCSYDEASTIVEDGDFRVTRNYTPFLQTSSFAKAYGYDSLTDAYTMLSSAEGVKDTSAVSVRVNTDTTSAEMTYSYVFASASASFFSDELLGNGSYANYDVTSALLRNISRVDEHASLELGGTSLNSPSYGGKQLLDTAIVTEDTKVYDESLKHVETNYALDNGMKVFFYILIAIVPVAAAAFGAYVCIRRRFL